MFNFRQKSTLRFGNLAGSLSRRRDRSSVDPADGQSVSAEFLGQFFRSVVNRGAMPDQLSRERSPPDVERPMPLLFNWGLKQFC